MTALPRRPNPSCLWNRFAVNTLQTPCQTTMDHATKSQQEYVRNRSGNHRAGNIDYDDCGGISGLRDPTDKDPRTKDFLPVNLAQYSSLPDAFDPDSETSAARFHSGSFCDDASSKLGATGPRLGFRARLVHKWRKI